VSEQGFFSSVADPCPKMGIAGSQHVPEKGCRSFVSENAPFFGHTTTLSFSSLDYDAAISHEMYG